MEKFDVIYKTDSLASKKDLQDDLLTIPMTPKPIGSENLGLLLVFIAIFIFTFNGFLTKVIQIFYSIQFNTHSFLLIRTIMVFTLTIITSTYWREHILSYNEINNKIAFLSRTFFAYLCVLFFTVSVWYLRISTSQIISLLSPIFLIFFSVLILKEKFFMRYVYGLIICLTGSFLIVLNEKKANPDKDDSKELISIGTLIGISFGMLANVAGAFNSIANKVLVQNKVTVNTQMYYVSFSTFAGSLIGMIYDSAYKISFGYICLCFMQGAIFYCGQHLYNKGISMVALSKTAVINYFRIIWVFLLGGIFLGESIFFTDIFGAALIVAYQIYDVYNPINDKN